MNIESAKYKLIQFVMEIQNESTIEKLLAFIKQEQPAPKVNGHEVNGEVLQEDDPLAIARIPTPESISLDELIAEQGYSIEKLRAAHDQIDHSLWADEDLEEVLASI